MQLYWLAQPYIGKEILQFTGNIRATSSYYMFLKVPNNERQLMINISKAGVLAGT